HTNTLSLHDALPIWSPDGKRIAFRSDRDNNAEIYSIRTDGSDETRLTNSPTSDNTPRWGADGRIVFVTDRGTGAKTSLWVMNGDGSDQHRLSPQTFIWNETRPALLQVGRHVNILTQRDG